MSRAAEVLGMVTLDRVITEIKEIVDENPNFVYPELDDGCAYFVPELLYPDPDSDEPIRPESAGAPSCLVGHWFARHGLTLEDIGECNTTGIHATLRVLGVQVEPEARKFLEQVQILQDAFVPWGEAYAQTINSPELCELIKS